MKKYIIIVCMFLCSVHTFAQSEIQLFQLVKKPTTELLIDSLTTQSDSIGSLGNIFGDSIRVSAICKLSDTVNIYALHVEIGNQTSGVSNIYSDSLDFSLIPQIDSLDIYRKGEVIYMDLGVFEHTDTLYGEAWFYRTDGTPSPVIYYPL